MNRSFHSNWIILLLAVGLLFSNGCKKVDIIDSEKLGPRFSTQSHPIQIAYINNQAVFIDERSGEVFNPRGTNYFNIVDIGSGFQDRFFHPAHFDISEIRQNLRKLKEHGFNTIRVFLDTCNDDPGCIGNFDGPGLNKDYLQNIAALMQLAQTEDMFLLLTSNDLPDQGGYWDISNQGASELVDGYRNSHYITAEGVSAATLYWEDLMKGLLQVNAEFSHVFAWSILNEQWFFNNAAPFTLQAGTITAANGQTYSLTSEAEKERLIEESADYYINEVSEVIKRYDRNALVTTGIFAPNRPHEWRPNDFKYVARSVTQSSGLDFLDLHLYPGTSTMEKLMENFDLEAYETKPMIIGEVGAFVDIYEFVDEAQLGLQQWIASSCSYGFDGWLTWGYTRAPLAIGDATWSLLDENERLLVELSPEKYPDPCNEEWLGDQNIALGKPVEVSAELTDEIGAYAVDGDLSTQWGSGNHPPQWIEIDLQEVTSIARISLIVAQYPEGDTRHKIMIKGSSGNFKDLTVISMNTKEGDRLEWSGMQNNVQYVRIETTESPSWVSWKEIEVY